MNRSMVIPSRPRTDSGRRGRIPPVISALSVVIMIAFATSAAGVLTAQVASAAGSPGIYAPPDVVVGEADGSVTLPVTMNATSTSAITVNYTTADGSGSGNSTACSYPSSVYESTSGTLTFPAGSTTQNVTVHLLNCLKSLTTGFYTFYLDLAGNSSGSTINRSKTQIDVTGDVSAASTPALYAIGAKVDNTAGTVNVPVVLGGPSGAASASAVTVAYTTKNGSAVSGTDYTATSGTLTFPPGETAQNITVPIIDRSASAPSRSFSVTLSTPTNATIAYGTGVVTIGASGASAVSTPGISTSPDVVVGETDGYVDLPVTLNAPGVNIVTVNYTTADGSGSGNSTACSYASSVYQGESGTITFTPGVTLQVVRVPILNCLKSLTTGFYTFYLDLAGNSSGSTINRSKTQIDVTGDVSAASTPALYAIGAKVDNTAGTVNVPVVLGGPSGAASASAVTVAYTTKNGSAVSGTDYTATSGTLTFPPGETAQNITVPIIDRSASAPSRSFSVTLSTPTNATIAYGTGVVTIGASGASAVSTPGISTSPDVVVGETDGYVDLPVTLNAPGVNIVTVNYTTADGSGSGNSTACSYASSVYQGESGTITFTPGVTLQVVRVPILNCLKSLTTGFYTFYLDLAGNSSGSTINRSKTQIDVTGDVSAASTPALYAIGAKVDNTAGTVNVPVVLGGPSGAASASAVTVAYTTKNGSAVSGTDYTATSGTLTFPPGETAQNITVPIIDRSASAPSRSFSVTLSTPTNATIAYGTGVVTIGASGASAVSTPGISTSPDVVVGETDGYVDLPVTLNAPGVNIVTVNYTTADGSGSGNSTACSYASSVYQGESGTITFTPGVTLQVVRVPILNCLKSLTTGFYTFYLDLAGNSSGSTINRSKTQIDVTGDVSAASTPALYAIGAKVDNTAGTVNVPVVLGGPSGAASASAVTVAYTTKNGSAVSGTDYTATSGTLTFPPGETAQNITVPIIDRSASAPSRSFSVTLSTPTNATIAYGTGVVTIGASGASAVSTPGISTSPDVVVGETDGYVDLPVTLNAPGVNIVTVNYTTADGSGSGNSTACSYASSVYQGESGTITFTPGVTLQVVRVPILNCGQATSHTFLLDLAGNSSDSTIIDASTTITVDGATPPTITSFSPTSGAPGTKVTIKGTNLEGATSVTFKGKSAVITKDTATELVVKVPASAATGTITVTTSSGIATSSKKFKVT